MTASHDEVRRQRAKDKRQMAKPCRHVSVANDASVSPLRHDRKERPGQPELEVYLSHSFDKHG